jgi:hypothetical protein
MRRVSQDLQAVFPIVEGRMMRRILACVSFLFLASTLASAQEHLVSNDAVKSRVAEAVSQRAQDVAVLNHVLSTPEASIAAARFGMDAGGIKSALSTLSDHELSDLAARAQALRTDPSSGLEHDVNQLLVIFLIVAIVILVIQAVD